LTWNFVTWNAKEEEKFFDSEGLLRILENSTSFFIGIFIFSQRGSGLRISQGMGQFASRGLKRGLFRRYGGLIFSERELFFRRATIEATREAIFEDGGFSGASIGHSHKRGKTRDEKRKYKE
jgi:hypothetical protein